MRELREAIVEQYTTIIMSATDDVKDQYNAYLEGIFDFLEATLKLETVPNARIIGGVISLVGDLACQFPNHAGVKAKVVESHYEQGILFLQQ